MIKKILAVALASLLVGLGLVWHFQPPLPTANNLKRQADSDWVLPHPPAIASESDLKQIADRNLWGLVAPAPSNDPLTPPNWRIVGVFQVAEERVAILKYQADTTAQPAVRGSKAAAAAVAQISANVPKDAQLKVGDSLPGGSRIIAIADDFLGIVVNGKKRVLRIYRE